jgi:16S rRNA (adenine1518-N6/adenine1519-N6)-dimethyltransferase
MSNPDPAARPLPIDRALTRQDWQAILRERGIRPTRAMGQNFLVERSVVQRIADVADISEDDLVMEIGPGMGILTRELLARGARVIAVELDTQLRQFLEHDLGSCERLTLVERDARYVEIAQYVGARPYILVANLPYSVATVIIRHFLESETPPVALHVMVQREVAERMTASPPNMSLLALACQLHTEPEIAFIVPPDVFLPPPKVESAVVSMRVLPERPLTQAQQDMLFQLATIAFQRKRKTIANGLSQGLNIPKAELETALVGSHIDPMRRPETLTIEDWISLSARIRK